MVDDPIPQEEIDEYCKIKIAIQKALMDERFKQRISSFYVDEHATEYPFLEDSK